MANERKSNLKLMLPPKIHVTHGNTRKEPAELNIYCFSTTTAAYLSGSHSRRHVPPQVALNQLQLVSPSTTSGHVLHLSGGLGCRPHGCDGYWQTPRLEEVRMGMDAGG